MNPTASTEGLGVTFRSVRRAGRSSPSWPPAAHAGGELGSFLGLLCLGRTLKVQIMVTVQAVVPAYPHVPPGPTGSQQTAEL